MSVISMKQLLEAGVHFGTPNAPLEPEDGKVHLHRTQWYLYH